MSYYRGGSVNSQPFGLVYNSTYPNGTIPAGDPFATFSSFDPANGVFIPIYSPGSGLAISFDGAGGLIISGPGPQDGVFAPKQNMAGLRCRLRMFCDNTGILKFEFKIKNLSWNAVASPSFSCGLGIMIDGPQNGTTAYYHVGMGTAGFRSLTHLMINSQDVTAGKNGTELNEAGVDLGLVSPQAGPYWIRITMQYSTTDNPKNLLKINDLVEYSTDHVVWNTYNQNAKTWLTGWDLFNGIRWGAMWLGDYVPVFSGTIESFTLLNGFLSL